MTELNAKYEKAQQKFNLYLQQAEDSR